MCSSWAQQFLHWNVHCCGRCDTAHLLLCHGCLLFVISPCPLQLPRGTECSTVLGLSLRQICPRSTQGNPALSAVTEDIIASLSMTNGHGLLVHAAYQSHKLNISSLKITLSPGVSMACSQVAWQAQIQDVLQLYSQVLVSLSSSKFVHAAFKIAFTTS